MAGAAVEIIRCAVRLDLRGMPREGAPALDLQGIDLRNAAAEIVAAVPLEPAARIGANDPPFLAPYGEGLAAFDSEAVEIRVRHCTDFGVCEPVGGEFVPAIVAVFAFENAVFEHLAWGKKGRKPFGELASYRRDERICIAALHTVVDGNDGIVTVGHSLLIGCAVYQVQDSLGTVEHAKSRTRT